MFRANNADYITVVRQTFRADGDEADTLALDKLQSFVDVGQLVNAHLSAVRFRQLFTGDDL